MRNKNSNYNSNIHFIFHVQDPLAIAKNSNRLHFNYTLYISDFDTAFLQMIISTQDHKSRHHLDTLSFATQTLATMHPP